MRHHRRLQSVIALTANNELFRDGLILLEMCVIARYFTHSSIVQQVVQLNQYLPCCHCRRLLFASAAAVDAAALSDVPETAGPENAGQRIDGRNEISRVSCVKDDYNRGRLRHLNAARHVL